MDEFKFAAGLVDDVFHWILVALAWMFRNLWVRQSELEKDSRARFEAMERRNQTRHDELRNALNQHHDKTMDLMREHIREEHRQ